jgi:cytosine/adenosine deaminase-related metal-dependent hydrolase
MQPVHDPVSTVVMQTTLANIDSVMVAGRWKKRHGRLLDVDLAPKLAALRASGAKIAGALGLAKA